MDMKPDATDLVDLPGYNKSARNLMPPPENKVEEENFANAQNLYDEPLNGGNQAKDEFQVIFKIFWLFLKLARQQRAVLNQNKVKILGSCSILITFFCQFCPTFVLHSLI